MRCLGTIFAAVASCALGLSAPSAQAGYVVDLTQEGGNVVATGSGEIDLTGLTLQITAPALPAISPQVGNIVTGLSGFTSADLYGPLSGPPLMGPSNFGSGDLTAASSGGGDKVGVFATLGLVFVPAGYASDSPLSSTSTFDNTTLSGLGATPGRYEWTWGSGANQNFTLDIVPEPSTWAMMLLGFAGLGFVSYRQTRRAKLRAA